MQLEQPDPRYTASKKAQRNFVMAVEIAIMVAGFIWFIFMANEYLDLKLQRFGLRPRDLEGLVGVITAPLLHADLEHIFSNTLPLLISLTAVLFLYPNTAVRVLPMTWIGTGLLAWLIGRPSLHIGASGFVYGLLGFILVSGMLRRDMRSVGVSLLVWFLYGTMIWGVLPIRVGMSWEMHLSGALLGVAMAFLYRKWDLVPIKRYSWEEEEEEEEVPYWFPEPGKDDEDPEGRD
jgi:membrane associated rhomboid family serine protease